ncbi:MAG: hypothetical protein MI757_15125, partial [Pirellulales bacterium]|nr:hypothetical protein [Pirellulales bacterium]
VGGKYLFERNQNRGAEDRQKQLALVESQIDQAERERDELDARLPKGGGPLAVRLDAAQRKLSEIESLVAMDTDRQVAGTVRDSAAARARDAAEELKRSRKDWRRALQSLGLPDDLSPKQVGRIADESRSIAELTEQAARKQSDLEQQRRQYATYAQRVERIADEAQIPRTGRKLSQTLSDLVVATKTQRDVVSRRQQLKQHARKIKRRQAHYNESLENDTRRREQLLRECGVESKESLERIAADAARAASLAEQRTALDRDIDTAIAGVCGRQEIEAHLSTTDVERLERQFDQLAERAQSAAAQLKQLYQQQGQLGEQLRVMTEDRSLEETKLELGCVEQQLADACRQWQVLGTIHLALESVRRTYERDRQPETLRDASQYLNRLTDGRYVRVWTPLDEDVLRVDDAAGECLSADVLSRGTREQLFLSLRLALVRLYARRGVNLPLVLDDVFVNFDTRRAEAAAKLLTEFASAGHQLLVFTCHEHIAEMFRAVEVTVLELPNRGEVATSRVAETIVPTMIEEEPVEVVVEEAAEEDETEEDIVEEQYDDDVEEEAIENEEEYEVEELAEDDDEVDEVEEEYETEDEDEYEVEEVAEDDEYEEGELEEDVDEEGELEDDYEDYDEEEVLEEDEWEEFDDDEEEDDVSEAA